jgi:hypothetical protein
MTATRRLAAILAASFLRNAEHRELFLSAYAWRPASRHEPHPPARRDPTQP